MQENLGKLKEVNRENQEGDKVNLPGFCGPNFRYSYFFGGLCSVSCKNVAVSNCNHILQAEDGSGFK
jgi:hypothetical protein